ncbi:GntR family transcriptional regulator [Aurantimonas sp. A2-1-M11]|uniref:GntR family transcriptional regulator n=1 Tax=Aurantimonas sp. A2-1-M11 TaxID=3113712 RepID=UPI002F932D1A
MSPISSTLPRSGRPSGDRPAKARIRRHSLHHEVAETLRQMIIHGELQPGEKVPVASLSDRLGVSPTPLREALKVLAEERLVVIEVNRGARVAPYTGEEAVKLFEVIASVESLAAELTTRRMSDGEIAELEAMHAAMAKAFHAGDKDAYFDLNSAIHQKLVTASGNEELQYVHERLMLRAQRGRYMAILDADRWLQAFQEHEALMAALRARDSAAAAATWRIHLLNTGKTLGEVLRR